jgi:hypothetical protein
MTLPFLEKLLQLLAQGGFSATYKYAVLLGLLDLCLEKGMPPTSLTTEQLARRVIELYWPQVRPYRQTQSVLLQNSGEQASIAQFIQDYRKNNPNVLSPTIQTASKDYGELLCKVEWVLVRYPLPLLQRIGGGEERFLYEIGWGENVSKTKFSQYKKGKPDTFDNRILFKPGAAESLRALSPLLRPLIQQHWMAKVRLLNKLPETELEDFLFGTDRIRLKPLQKPLRELQCERCFYCKESLTGECQVDHFLPCSRYPDDGLDNLVLAHDSCNRNKLHFLAALDFAKEWETRSRGCTADLDDIAKKTNWMRDRTRTFGVVSGVYQNLSDGVWLWAGKSSNLRRLEKTDLEQVHTFGRGLLV